MDKIYAKNRQNGTLFASFDRGENGLKIFENQHVDTKWAQKTSF